MGKKEAKIIKNLRLGIPAAALAVAPATLPAAEKEAAFPDEKTHKTEITAPEAKTENNKAYRAEGHFIYDEEGLKHVSGTDTLSVTYETQNPKNFIKRQKQSLYAAYAQAEADNELLQTGTFVFDSAQKLKEPESGWFDNEKKLVKVNTFAFDPEFLEKFIRKSIVNNDNLFDYYIVEQGRNINDVVAELKGPLEQKLLEEFNAERRMKNTRTHEEKHLKNDRSGNNLAGISPRQYAQLVQTDEISANIAVLLDQRREYLKTGNINCFSDEFEYYKKAVEQKQIVPGSRVKELEERELSFIMNQTQQNWLTEYQDFYQEQIMDLTGRMMKNPLSTIQPDGKELESRERSALTFEFNGRKVDLYDYRTEAPAVSDTVSQKLSEMMKQRSHGLGYGKIKSVAKRKKALALQIQAKRGRIPARQKSAAAAENLSVYAQKRDISDSR
ncbi:MAG: hypothetical protein SO314_02585 [Alphaproteobacteria bacterium]|nr:hypothetical protein [Alphaproteobacteria bacterium]